MQSTSARFVRLRNVANLRSGRANAGSIYSSCGGVRGEACRKVEGDLWRNLPEFAR